jgi:hypothetical protein
MKGTPNPALQLTAAERALELTSRALAGGSHATPARLAASPLVRRRRALMSVDSLASNSMLVAWICCLLGLILPWRPLRRCIPWGPLQGYRWGEAVTSGVLAATGLISLLISYRYMDGGNVCCLSPFTLALWLQSSGLILSASRGTRRRRPSVAGYAVGFGMAGLPLGLLWGLVWFYVDAYWLAPNRIAAPPGNVSWYLFMTAPLGVVIGAAGGVLFGVRADRAAVVRVGSTRSATREVGSVKENIVTELQKLESLRQSGALTEDEFARAKAELLHTTGSPAARHVAPGGRGVRVSVTGAVVGATAGGLLWATVLPLYPHLRAAIAGRPVTPSDSGGELMVVMMIPSFVIGSLIGCIAGAFGRPLVSGAVGATLSFLSCVAMRAPFGGDPSGAAGLIIAFAAASGLAGMIAGGAARHLDRRGNASIKRDDP